MRFAVGNFSAPRARYIPTRRASRRDRAGVRHVAGNLPSCDHVARPGKAKHRLFKIIHEVERTVGNNDFSSGILERIAHAVKIDAHLAASDSEYAADLNMRKLHRYQNFIAMIAVKLTASLDADDELALAIFDFVDFRLDDV
jgi:hypothetical protein